MSLTDRRDLRRAANVVGVLVLIALVVPFVVYGAPQAVGADESFVVLSGSMEPAMSPGDVVVVRDAQPGTVEAGDVITFRTDNPTPTTHRVIEVVSRDDTTAYVTKGDANEDPDSGVVAHDRVIGTVMLVIPFLGYAIRFVNTPVGFAVVVVAPLLLFVGGELRSLVGAIDSADPPEGADEVTEAEADGSDDPASAPVPAHDPNPDSDPDRPEADAAAADTGGSDAVAGDDAAATAASADGGPTEGDDGASLTLTRSSLQIIALIFAVYLPYSAYVAYQIREAWTMTVAIATAVGLLFVVGVYAGSGESDDAAADGDSPDDGNAPDGPDIGPDRAVVDGGVDAGIARADAADVEADADVDVDVDDGAHSEPSQGQRHTDRSGSTNGGSTSGDEARSDDGEVGHDA